MKVALITGGSRGIGKAICLRLAAEGCHVLINYKSNETEALNTLAQIKEQGGRGELIQFDCSSKQEVEEKLDAWKTQNPDLFIEILVNNAGIKKDQLLALMQDEEWDDVLQTNLNGWFYVTRAAGKGMISKRRGRIINMVSLSGIKGLPGQTNYSATKGGIIAATKSLAQELGRRNITVNAVAPGFIETDMTKDIDPGDYKAIIPAGRFGKPEEVAHAVAFLASDLAAYINGSVIQVNGGLYT